MSPDIIEKVPVNVLAIAFLVVFILTFLLSAGFIYHWKRYSLNAPVAATVTVLYVIVTTGLIAISVGLLGVVFW